ncbi:MAG TPA: hypothetical protein VMG99_09140 [Thermoplasmata archaeon]|nr:hypothetical protein [Thermoplasmata archaeon]
MPGKALPIAVTVISLGGAGALLYLATRAPSGSGGNPCPSGSVAAGSDGQCASGFVPDAGVPGCCVPSTSGGGCPAGDVAEQNEQCPPGYSPDPASAGCCMPTPPLPSPPTCLVNSRASGGSLVWPGYATVGGSGLTPGGTALLYVCVGSDTFPPAHPPCLDSAGTIGADGTVTFQQLALYLYGAGQFYFTILDEATGTLSNTVDITLLPSGTAAPALVRTMTRV